MDYRYNLHWPREGLYIDTFVHEVFNYRYHWHNDDYELSILLDGRQAFCRGTENITLEADDVLLIPPGTGHASSSPEPNTLALVLHFSAAVFKPYVKKGSMLTFPSCCSDPSSRNSNTYRRIRFCAAQILDAAVSGGPYALLHARAGLSMLLSTLCSAFDPQTVTASGEAEQMAMIKHLITFIEERYADRITLEDLAAYAQYNRTYVSTLFKNIVGINFYEYLTRYRFQRALIDLTHLDKNLTNVALDNGFPDLKSFNKRFRETFGQSPAEYRSKLQPDRVISDNEIRRFVSPDDSTVQQKISSYLLDF